MRVETPELDKQLQAIQEGHSQEIGAMLEWMEGQGIHRMRWETYMDERPCWTDSVHHAKCVVCGGTGYTTKEVSGWVYDKRDIQRLLADYFDIDQQKIAEEQQALLNDLRTKATTA